MCGAHRIGEFEFRAANDFCSAFGEWAFGSIPNINKYLCELPNRWFSCECVHELAGWLAGWMADLLVLVSLSYNYHLEQ